MSSPPLDESQLPRAVVEAWRADQPSAGELRRGYARYLRRRSTRSALRPWLWVAIGVLLGVSLAQAATLVSARWFNPSQRAVSAPPPSRAAAATTPAKPAIVAPSAVTSQPSVGTAPVLVPTTAPAPVGRIPSPLPGEPADTRMQEQWRNAAEALRSDDFARAHQALLEIERSALGGERDAARLARAQLLASHGRRADATLLLVELRERAQSELVRRKAGELLQESSENVGPDRSAGPGRDTKQP